jgi:hypothetical protein
MVGVPARFDPSPQTSPSLRSKPTPFFRARPFSPVSGSQPSGQNLTT